jgi:hypothetical protein
VDIKEDGCCVSLHNSVVREFANAVDEEGANPAERWREVRVAAAANADSLSDLMMNSFGYEIWIASSEESKNERRRCA